MSEPDILKAMQPGGFGGGQGNGYPPGGPPGHLPGAPQPPGSPPQQPYAAPQQQPGAPQQPYGAPLHGAPPPHQPYGAPPQPYGAPPQPPYGVALPHPYVAPQPGQQYPGMPAPGQYGAPAHFGAPPPGAFAGMPGTPVGPMPGAVGQMPGVPGHSSFGQAQSALAGAGGMMTAMKWGFVGIGVLCALGGIALAVMVDVVTGVSMVFTGAVFVVVALLVLPRFSGMLGQATAMVDGFAAKERLAQTGVPASGRLLSVQQTGRLVNYNPEIQAVVEVHHPQLGVYQTQTTAIVPQIAIPRAQPGAQVQVRVSPQNQHEIALVF